MTRRLLGGFILAQRQMSNLLLRQLSALTAVSILAPGQSQSAPIVAAIHAPEDDAVIDALFIALPHPGALDRQPTPHQEQGHAPGAGSRGSLFSSCSSRACQGPSNGPGHTASETPPPSAAVTRHQRWRVTAWTPEGYVTRFHDGLRCCIAWVPM